MATTTTPRGLPPNGETTNPANFHPRRVGRRRRRRRARLPTALRAKACSRRGFVAWRVSRVRATKKAIPVDGCTVRGVREVVGAPQSCPPQFLSLVSLLLQIKDPGLRFFCTVGVGTQRVETTNSWRMDGLMIDSIERSSDPEVFSMARFRRARLQRAVLYRRPFDQRTRCRLPMNGWLDGWMHGWMDAPPSHRDMEWARTIKGWYRDSGE
mmetsp:Transcript_8552/g.25318  ORF Transcript_8552/g.25318 Transcript_8552/m.25318 type:complete len:211 (+) Transcript_8552:577-1209(+)